MNLATRSKKALAFDRRLDLVLRRAQRRRQTSRADEPITPPQWSLIAPGTIGLRLLPPRVLTESERRREERVLGAALRIFRRSIRLAVARDKALANGRKPSKLRAASKRNLSVAVHGFSDVLDAATEKFMRDPED